MRTHYDNLKIQENATQQEVRSAYKSLAQKWHPDKHKENNLASRNFRIIKHSYDVLSNVKKRLKYDQFLERKRSSEVYDIAIVSSARDLSEREDENKPLRIKDFTSGLDAKTISLGLLGLLFIASAIWYNIVKAMEGSNVAIGAIALIFGVFLWQLAEHLLKKE